ncbi:MAG: glycosyltransferase [Sphingobacteriaceae bacterium]|nr:MAG: glycosyltransferase [Sphingobacteriaceae bacterium]
MPLFSIIVPTYNSESTLELCLTSIATQMFQDFEILIIDGNSSDNTMKIVKGISEVYGNTKWISEPDLGIYDAMNKGISKASGDWIYFLGSDDYILDDKVLRDVAVKLNNTSASIVYGNAIVKSDNKSKGGEFSLHKLLTEGNLCHQTIFYKRSVFDILGKFNLKYPILADWDFNVKVFLEKRPTRYKNLLVVQYSNKGYSSQHRDLQFEEKLTNIKAKYYEHFLHRLNSRYHYLKKRIKRLL